MSQSDNISMYAADGTPLKKSLARALRREKLRALLLIAPLLIFVLMTFIVPIGNMLFRSVENQMVEKIIPRTVDLINDWNPQSAKLPPDEVFKAAFYDLSLAVEAKEHTKLGTRLNYEQTGASSTFRKSGRGLDDPGKDLSKLLSKFDRSWKDRKTLLELFNADGADENKNLIKTQIERLGVLEGKEYQGKIDFLPSSQISQALPLASREYTMWAVFTSLEEEKKLSKAKPWPSIYVALIDDLQNEENKQLIENLDFDLGELIRKTFEYANSLPKVDYKQIMIDADEGWADPKIWVTIKTHSSKFTSGYFLNAIDMQKTLGGIKAQPENKQILIKLFNRTVQMSLIITLSCILLGYPIAWLLANLPTRVSNLLMILVLLPFWTSLLVRTSAWKVMLQQQGVINEVLVWLGIVSTDNRLEIIHNQFGTIVAMTHILLPFMILPMYSVMQTIPPSYLRAAKSLGATNWTAFWRVYFPQSIPGIGAGSILVFILSIGYYITPEIVGGREGVFISNRIAYHISSSLNWGLAAALGAILLAVVLILYWAYDKIVGIDNVKLG